MGRLLGIGYIIGQRVSYWVESMLLASGYVIAARLSCHKKGILLRFSFIDVLCYIKCGLVVEKVQV